MKARSWSNLVVLYQLILLFIICNDNVLLCNCAVRPISDLIAITDSTWHCIWSSLVSHVHNIKNSHNANTNANPKRPTSINLQTIESLHNFNCGSDVTLSDPARRRQIDAAAAAAKNWSARRRRRSLKRGAPPPTKAARRGSLVYFEYI